MQTINISNLRKDLYKTVENVLNFEPVRVNTKNGNAILMSEEEYRNLEETVYLCSIPKMKESILEASSTPLEECIKEENFEW
ncbi:MAG: type II toxin-antitoxin system Phd/YefM family antitoxin [Mailhella sp.]|nr:type II toxin-antitoxin system Phd/YefM family antitoxin [Mailhella sp.]